MKNQPLFLASAVAGALSFLAAGCLLGSDPNKNSMLFGAPGGSTGSVGGNGGTGTTGAGGSSLDTVVGFPLATFDTTKESFAFSTYADTQTTNLGASNNTGTLPTLTWDSSDASPSGGGSLKVTAPYSGANQYVDIQSPSFPTTMLRNWSGGKLHVRVRVDPGSTFVGQIEPYVDTTPPAYNFVGSSFNSLGMGNAWRELVVPLDTAMTQIAGYDLKQVVLFGVHIGSGTGGATQGPVTFHIDTFTIEGVAAPPVVDASVAADTGTGTADSGTGAADDASGN